MSTTYTYPESYDVIIVGGGHAGCEAAFASVRTGAKTLLLTMNIDTVALMPCNPAIGGVAKGQLVREIDALGGEMARCIDETGIQFRVLNTKKGPAVQSYRAQADKNLYRQEMTRRILAEEKLEVKQGIVENILVENGRVEGVLVDHGVLFKGRAVVVATGTFLNGLIHVGDNQFPAGRVGESAVTGLSNFYREQGFNLGRLKTGTPPRLDGKTIDFSVLGRQNGDPEPKPFSFSNRGITQKQVPCFIAYTNQETHDVIRENFSRSPLYSGAIKGVGPRYCPSIEDKIRKFPDKDRHHIFLEPEGYDNVEYYPNGVSTSLPVDIQLKFLRTIKGLERVQIVRPGYAIEYDYILPTQLKETLETKSIGNLFHAGQVNGTSGYEEAAAQGLMAGANASLVAQGRAPFLLSRSEAYIGVLIDDLVTKGTEEPYRMFTSRAEYRLLLRNDNADLRLSERAFKVGLIKESEYKSFDMKKQQVEQEIRRLQNTVVKWEELSKLQPLPSEPSQKKDAVLLSDFLKRPKVSYDDLPGVDMLNLPVTVKEEVEIQIKYEGYIRRQLVEVERLKKIENKKIPPGFDYSMVGTLSNEIRQKLSDVRPLTLGQASRVSGVTPAALMVLGGYIEKHRKRVV